LAVATAGEVNSGRDAFLDQCAIQHSEEFFDDRLPLQDADMRWQIDRSYWYWKERKAPVKNMKESPLVQHAILCEIRIIAR